MRPHLIARALALLLVVLPAVVAAQDLPPDPAEADAPPPITLVHVEGRVEIARASGVEPAQAPDLLEEDDRLITGDGRAELAYTDGSLAHLDRGTEVRIDLGVRLRLVRGRVVMHAPPDGDPLELATPAGLVRLEPDGEYDLAADDLDGDTVVAVVRGRAVLASGDQDVPVAADDELRVDPRDRRPRWARAALADVFRHWSRSRLPATTRVTGDYDLPGPLVPYAQQFAVHGQWANVAPHGAVWFPSARGGWRPYANGSWRYTRYGWTWIDRDPWAWPVHHFGRWGRHDARGWYWIPQPTWGPAWVGWAMGADHVAWSPLGWDRRPVVDFFAGARFGPIEVWANSWSVLARRNFGHRLPAYRYLEDPRRLPGPVLGGFVSQMIGPRGPAGYDDRFRARAGRGAWRPPAGRTTGGGRDERGRREAPGAREGREGGAYPRRDLQESFGSATPSRRVDDGETSRPVGGAVNRRDDTGRAPLRRPGDARSPAGTVDPPAAVVAPRSRERSAGESRAPDSIRPRYERPDSGAAASPPAPVIQPAPVVAPPPPERGDGARGAGRGVGAAGRGDDARGDDSRGGRRQPGASGVRGAGAGSPADARGGREGDGHRGGAAGGAVDRGTGGRGDGRGAAPARPGGSPSGGDGNRRRRR